MSGQATIEASRVKPLVMILGPSLDAVSGVTTHLRELMQAPLLGDVEFVHFQVGSEGRREGPVARALRLAVSPFSLFSAILRRRPRIVHINTSFDPKAYWRDVVYLMVARLAGCRVVYQVHGGARPQHFFRGRRLLESLLRRVMQSADAVVVLSDGEAADFRSFSPGARLRAIPNAVDAPALAFPLREVNRDAPLRLVYLGRLAREKGLREVVEAAATLASHGVDFELHVAGSGADEGAMRGWAEAAGLKARIAWHGPLSGAAKVRFWRSGDVFVFPSHAEGLPYAVLEAMAAGAVPVASRVGAIPEVLEDGVHGLLVAPRDPAAVASAILRLHGDRDTLGAMQRAGQQRVLGAFSSTRLAADFRELYAGL